MSKLCVSAFVAILIFVLALIIVWLVAKPDPGSLTAKEALEEIRKSADLTNKIFSYLVYLTRFLWKGLLGLIITISVAAFTCLGAICSDDTVEVLKVVRLILQDIFAFLERLLGAT